MIDSNTSKQGTAHCRLKDQPASERPRERLIEYGPAALSPAELIAILVRTGLRGTNALEIGKQLIQKFGSLSVMSGASVDDLCHVRGIGRDKAVTLVAAFTLAAKMAEELRWESSRLPFPYHHCRIAGSAVHIQEATEKMLEVDRVRFVKLWEAGIDVCGGDGTFRIRTRPC